MNKTLAMVIALYDYADNQTKELYKEQKQNRDELLKLIALLLLTYDVVDDKVNIPTKEKTLLLSFISKCAKSQCSHEEKILTNILKNTVTQTWGYYNYNYKQRDVLELIKKDFKGKSFSDRIWDNGDEIAKELEKKLNRFIKGEINVSQIKAEINKTYNKGAYNTKRLVDTEVSNCMNNAFMRFCKETDVKHIKRNATLDSRTCEDCIDEDGKVYELRNAPMLPSHPFVDASMRFWISLIGAILLNNPNFRTGSCREIAISPVLFIMQKNNRKDRYR